MFNPYLENIMLIKLDTLLKGAEKVGRVVGNIETSDRYAEAKAILAGLRASTQTAYNIGKAEVKFDKEQPVQQEFDFGNDNELS